MLRFDLAEIIRTPGMRQVLEIDEPPYADEDVEYVAPVSGRMTVTNTGSLLLIRGRLQTVVAMECSRCLGDVRVPIDTEIEEEFPLELAEDLAHRDKQVRVTEEPIGEVFEGSILRMDVLIRQAALLAAPLQPLCREDCPGIPINTPKQNQDEPAEGLSVSPFHGLSDYLRES